jgi:hypothetical protein
MAVWDQKIAPTTQLQYDTAQTLQTKIIEQSDCKCVPNNSVSLLY